MILYDATAKQCNFETLAHMMGEDLLHARDVDTGHWQSVEDPNFVRTRELQNAVLVMDMPWFKGPGHEGLATMIGANMPWAEDHFQERVSRIPHNPPPSYEWWPFNKKGEAFQKDKKFSHTYPERFWPKTVGTSPQKPALDAAEFFRRQPQSRMGLRYELGDLDDVVNLLVKYPRTRQAWLPVWFPEDTGAAHGERVPCSLGYHFSLRGGRLDCHYVIRSVDFLRHFRDDVYMAVRLAQWVLGEIKERVDLTDISDDEQPWDKVTLGELTMTMFSLHVFEGDLPMMRHMYE